ncbi:MAG: DUF4129 domain-containing protein [Gammaproteobacteria bacterium]|nr:DUF4129 domain-containing protein [Gammaproteobacteria bacterium]
MELERLASRVRPRRSWEAMDLGFRLVQAWWWPVQRAWLLFALPAFALAFLLLQAYPSWIPLLFWWLKPLYERAPLEVLAQAQFGHVPGTRELLRQWRRLLLRQAIPALTWRRFTLIRSFSTPVMQLEGLAGDERAQRLRVLAQGPNTRGAQWLTFGCLHLEGLVYLAILALLAALVPQELQLDWQGALTGEDARWEFLLAGAGFLGTALVAPFYVAGGFALYLNRRTELEAWDIELAFRRMKKRLAGGLTTSIVLALVLAAGWPAEPVWAAEPATATAPKPLSEEERVRIALDEREPPSSAHQAARAAVDEVLAGPDFHRMDTEGHWKLRDFDLSNKNKKPKTARQSWLEGLGAALAGGFKFLLYIALALLLLFLLHRYPQWSRWLGRNPRLKREAKALPEQVAGLDVRPESLPEDVAASAEALARAGDARAALGLLYRASLAALVHREALSLKASHTEGEILRLAQAQRPAAAWLAYLESLTRAWQALAYGHDAPPTQALLALCGEWRPAFDAEARS